MVLKDLSRKAPLLLAELVTTPDGLAFGYSTAIDAIHSRIVAVFDRAVTKLQVGPGCCVAACGSSACAHDALPARKHKQAGAVVR